MVSIKDLRSRLAQAQSKAARLRLTSSQCIDLMLKVCQTKNVQLISGHNGTLVMTPEQLELDVLEEIEFHGGRVCVCDVVQVLRVQQHHVERTVNILVEKHKDKLTCIHGVVMNHRYLTSLMQLLNERLTECGTLDLCLVAQEFQLGFDLLKSLVLNHLGKSIYGILDGRCLESVILDQNKKRRIKAAIVAILYPTPFSKVAKTTGLDLNLVNEMLQQYVKVENLGVIKGQVYIPRVYTEIRAKHHKKLYETRGYISISDANEYSSREFKEMFKDGVTLATVVVRNSVVDSIGTCISQAIASESFADFGPCLPCSIESSDFSALIPLLKGSKNGNFYQGIFVSHALVEQGVQQLLSYHLGNVDASQYQMLENRVAEILEANPDLVLSQLHCNFGSECNVDTQYFKDFIVALRTKLLAMMNESKSANTGAVAVKMLIKQKTLDVKRKWLEACASVATLERIKAPPGNVVTVTMCKEVFPEIAKGLESLYVLHHLGMDAADGLNVNDGDKQGDVSNFIAESEAGPLLTQLANGIKQRDVLVCMQSTRELFGLLYISYNAKKDLKNFLETLERNYRQQRLDGNLRELEPLKLAHLTLCCVMIKCNSWVYTVPKKWSIDAALQLLPQLEKRHPELCGHVQALADDYQVQDVASAVEAVILELQSL